MKTTTLVLCLLGSATQACPTKTDLATGIKVTEEDNVTHIYTRLDESTVRKITNYDASDEDRTNLRHGAYPVHSVWADDGLVDLGSLLVPYYDDDLPVPENGLVWEGMARVLSGYDGLYDETLSIKWGSAGLPLTKITIGACNYSTLQGTLVSTNEFETYTQTLAYIPDLGIALQYAFQYENSDPENFAFTRIEAVGN